MKKGQCFYVGVLFVILSIIIRSSLLKEGYSEMATAIPLVIGIIAALFFWFIEITEYFKTKYFLPKVPESGSYHRVRGKLADQLPFVVVEDTGGKCYRVDEEVNDMGNDHIHIFVP